MIILVVSHWRLKKKKKPTLPVYIEHSTIQVKKYNKLFNNWRNTCKTGNEIK
jgi:hypothetical protein